MGGNGFLLGAGASFELGMPLTDELTAKFRRELLSTLDTPNYKVSKTLAPLITKLLERNDLNYEEIMGRIEVEIQRNPPSHIYQELYGILSKYNEAISFFLLERHERNIQYILDRLQLFSPLADFCKKDPLWVFSLNHDLLFEMIVRYLNIPIQFGFFDKVEISGLSFERLSRENMETPKFSFLYKDAGVNLIRIHGALDIFVQGDEKNYLKLVNENSVDGMISDLLYLQQNDATSKLYGVRVPNEITYSEKSGPVQFLRRTIMSGKHKYSNRVQHVGDDWFYKIFRGHINHVDTLYVIGYSFGDIHINERLLEWITFRSNKKIVIVDPGIEEIPPFLRHLVDQVEIEKTGFLAFLNKNSDDLIKAKISLNNKARLLAREESINQYPWHTFDMLKLQLKKALLMRKLHKLNTRS